MFRYERAKILPHFLKQGMPVAELARKANISHQSAQRALEGKNVSAVIIARVANALGIDPMEFLEIGGESMFSKKTVTIVKEDGTSKEVEILVDDSGKAVGYWGDDDDDAQKVFAKHLSDTAEK